jgi:SAM-dependent methyltransferase
MVDVQVDITDMQFEDDSFDVIVCSHVLEHVADDARAMREMRRILRPDGRAFLQHPIDHAREATYEDGSVDDPQERARVFGQWDHVRVYGRDFPERLRAAGFSVEYAPYRDQVSPEQVHRSALSDADPKRADDIYICTPAGGEAHDE